MKSIQIPNAMLHMLALVATFSVSTTSLAQSFTFDTSQNVWIGIDNRSTATASAPTCGADSDILTLKDFGCLPILTTTLNAGAFTTHNARSASKTCPQNGNASASVSHETNDTGASYSTTANKIEVNVSATMLTELNTGWDSFNCGCCPRCFNPPSASAGLMMNAYDISGIMGCDYTYPTEVETAVIKVPFTVTGTPGTFYSMKVTQTNTTPIPAKVDINSQWWIKPQNDPNTEIVCIDDGSGNCDGSADLPQLSDDNGTRVTCVVIRPGSYVLMVDVNDINMFEGLGVCDFGCPSGEISFLTTNAKVVLELLPPSCP